MFGLDKIANAITKPLDVVSKGLEFTDKLKDIPVIGDIADKALNATPVGKVLNAVETGVGAATSLAKGDLMGVVDEFKDGAIKMIPGGEEAMGLLGKVNDFTGGKLGEMAGDFVEGKLGSQQATENFDDLAAQVGNMSDAEFDALLEDPAAVDELLNSSGLTEDFIDDNFGADPYGYSDPSSSSAYDPSDPNAGLSSSDFFGNNGSSGSGSGSNVVNPFNTSNVANVGNAGNTPGMNHNTTAGGNNNTGGGNNNTGGGNGFLSNGYTAPDPVDVVASTQEQLDEFIENHGVTREFKDITHEITKDDKEADHANEKEMSFLETAHMNEKTVLNDMQAAAKKRMERSERAL